MRQVFSERSGCLVVAFALVSSFFPLAFGYTSDTISVQDGAAGVAVNTKTGTVYVANEGSDSVSVVEGNKVVATVEVGSGPVGVAVNPVTGMVYVTNYIDGTVSVIDGLEVVETIEVEDRPFGVAVDPQTNMVYVANEFFDSVSVIDGATNKVVETIGVDGGPVGIAVNPKTGIVYVAAENLDVLSIIQDNKILANVTVGFFPVAVGVNPETNKVYVANEDSDTVSVIEGNELIANVTVGSFPVAIDVDSQKNMVYVANEDSNTVSVIDGSQNKVTGTIKVGDAPRGVALDPDKNTLYVTGSLFGILYVISNIDESQPSAKPFTLSSTHDGKTFTITGQSENARPTSFVINPYKSVQIEMEGQGDVELVLPAEMIDGIHTVTADGKAVEFQEISATTSSNTIRFAISEDSTVEISGSRVIPEFSTIALLVMATSFAAIIGLASMGQIKFHFDQS